MVEKNNVTPWDEFHEECKMTLDEFIEDVELGCFTDYDGYGVYATEEGYTDIYVHPSDKHFKTEYPYICWFNK